jgi:phage shock protein PspC (stress-responsive transcriptional regulator)
MGRLARILTPSKGDSMGLERSRTDKMIAGVCGGIAKQYGWDTTLVRIVYVVVSLFSAAFPGILLYLVLWFLMPQETTPAAAP